MKSPFAIGAADLRRNVRFCQQPTFRQVGVRGRSLIAAVKLGDGLTTTRLMVLFEVGDGVPPLCWNEPIYAPASGRVVTAISDVPDGPPNTPVPRGGSPGNHLIIDLGTGEYAHIAHLKKGTVSLRRHGSDRWVPSGTGQAAAGPILDTRRPLGGVGPARKAAQRHSAAAPPYRDSQFDPEARI